jgi:hypothetical protein
MSTLSTINPEPRLLSNHGWAQVWQSPVTGHKSLLSAEAFQPGDIICSFTAGEILSVPTYLTVQTGINRHITLQPDFLQYINHHCSPNIFFDTTNFQIICLLPLEPGDELGFFYPSTEWDMSQPFNCHCGSPNCLHEIKGAAWLPLNVLEQYRLTDFIQQQLQSR